MPVEQIQCGEFSAVIDWAGRIYSTVCYEVRVRVTSLAQASAALAAIRETIKREKPDWEGGEHERLVGSEWRDNPVYLVVDYSVEYP